MSEQRDKVMSDLNTIVMSEQTGNRWMMSAAQAAIDEIASLRADRAVLLNPTAVHANMLHGTIAKPSLEQIEHLYPEITSLRAQLAIAETNVRKWNDAFDVQSAQLASARKALEPFAACVFSDNGDVTVTTSDLRVEHYMRAKMALTDEKGTS